MGKKLHGQGGRAVTEGQRLFDDKERMEVFRAWFPVLMARGCNSAETSSEQVLPSKARAPWIGLFYGKGGFEH